MEGHQPEMAEAFGPECDREVVGKWLLDLHIVGAVKLKDTVTKSEGGSSGMSQEQGIFIDLC